MISNRTGKTRVRSTAVRHVAGRVRQPAATQAGEPDTAVVAGSTCEPSPVPRDDEQASVEEQHVSAASGEPDEQDLIGQQDQDGAFDARGHDKEPAPRRGRLRRGLRTLLPRRTRSLLALIAVSALLGTGLSLWFHAEADTLRSTPQARNAALLDQATTRQLTGQVADSLEKLWSYHHQQLAQHGDKVRNVATKSFLKSYQKQFDRIRKLAPKQQAVVSATVTEIAVRSLHGNHATLIAFLNQQATKNASEEKTKAASRLRVEATRVNDRWLISTVTPF